MEPQILTILKCHLKFAAEETNPMWIARPYFTEVVK